MDIILHLTSVSAVRPRGAFVLIRQLTDSGFGLFVSAGILLIPPHTRNIMQKNE